MRQNLKGAKIMVTGGAGFIGSHLVDRLLKEEAECLVAVDNMFLGREENLQNAIEKGAVLYKEDIENPSALDYIFSKHKIDIVFNCATKALNYSFINPRSAFDTNVIGVLNLLELQRRGRFNSLIHFSTSEVYGTAVYEPMDEKHPINPTTTYAAGKAAADLAVNSYVNMFDLDAFIVRPFNNYGPRQNQKGNLAGVIPITATRILNGKKPIIHGTGNQSRDFIYVDDTIDAVIKLFPILKKGEGVNISTNGQITIKNLIQQIADLLNYRGELELAPSRQADVRCHNASNNKIKGLIDFQLTEFEVGLKKTLNWIVENSN